VLRASSVPSKKVGRQPRGARPVNAAVLAVTVDRETRDVLLELAVAEGFGLRCVATFGEATAIIGREAPGLLLVDLDLPAGGSAAFLRSFRKGPHGDVACMALTATNDPMLAVSIDAPVFYKPDLDGIQGALEHLFWPDGAVDR